jgi:hypothetical protein
MSLPRSGSGPAQAAPLRPGPGFGHRLGPGIHRLDFPGHRLVFLTIGFALLSVAPPMLHNAFGAIVHCSSPYAIRPQTEHPQKQPCFSPVRVQQPRDYHAMHQKPNRYKRPMTGGIKSPKPPKPPKPARPSTCPANALSHANFLHNHALQTSRQTPSFVVLAPAHRIAP